MKRAKFLIFSLFLVGGLVATAQILNKKPAEAPEEIDISELVRECKKKATLALDPYRYDASKITYFLYKPFNQVKEVEVFFFNNAEYRLSFNSEAVADPAIAVEIFDKPQGTPGRILLFKKEGVKGGEFLTTSTDLKNELIKAVGKEDVYLKKVYIDYVIPSKKKETHQNERTGEVSTIRTKGAMVLALGYKNV